MNDIFQMKICDILFVYIPNINFDTMAVDLMSTHTLAWGK